MEITTDNISRLFFSQVKKMSIEASRQSSVYAFSVQAPATMEVGI